MSIMESADRGSPWESFGAAKDGESVAGSPRVGWLDPERACKALRDAPQFHKRNGKARSQNADKRTRYSKRDRSCPRIVGDRIHEWRCYRCSAEYEGIKGKEIGSAGSHGRCWRIALALLTFACMHELAEIDETFDSL